MAIPHGKTTSRHCESKSCSPATRRARSARVSGW
jgi:hypothetical protein